MRDHIKPTAYSVILGDLASDEPSVLIYEYNDAMSTLGQADHYLDSLDELHDWCDKHPGIYLTAHPFFETYEEFDNANDLIHTLKILWAEVKK